MKDGQTDPKIQTFKLKQLNPAKYNPRTITKEALDGLEKSLSKFGCVEPIIVNIRNGSNTIVGGHQRLKALLKINKPTAEVACVTVDLGKEDEKLLNLTLNNPEISGEFIEDLAEYIDQLRAELPDDGDYLDLRIDQLRGEIAGEEKEGLIDDDDVPEPPAVPITQKGDVWLLGENRLLCGDATVSGDVDRLMAGEKADMVFTDPPYNVDYEGGTKDKLKIKNDNMANPEFYQFLLKAYQNYFNNLKDGGCIYVAHPDKQSVSFQTAMTEAGLLLKQCLAWVKDRMVLGRQDYNCQHEPILYGWKPGAGHYFAGDFTLTTVIDDDIEIEELKKAELLELLKRIIDEIPTTVIREPKPFVSKLHPTMKPVALVLRCIKASSRPGELVLDLFGGAGSTLIAAEKIGRKCYSMELDPIYCDVIVKRWEQWTGRTAERE